MHILILNFIIAKSPEAVAFTKVKGHARQEHIEAGICSKEQAVGNGVADKLADKGTGLFTEQVTDAASWLRRRHDEYCKFMQKIHNIIISMMQASKDLRSKNNTTARNNIVVNKRKPQVSIPVCLEYANREHARPLAFKLLPLGKHKFHKHETFDSLREAVEKYVPRVTEFAPFKKLFSKIS